jgi:hypothetical protein
MTRPARVAVLAAAVLVLASCGDGSDEDGEDARVRGTVDTWRDGFAERDARKVCGALTPRARRAAPESEPDSRTCEDAVTARVNRAAGAEAEALRDADIEGVQINGRRARAFLVAEEEGAKRMRFSLERVGADWLIADVYLPE